MNEQNDFTIGEGSVPPDETPDFTPDPVDPGNPADPRNWSDPDFPYSTPEAPYGYFTISSKDDSPDYTRPRKRRPQGRGSRSGVERGNYPASEKSARTAAKLLAQMNLFVGMGISAFGLRLTARELVKANDQFEEMAYNALLSDPKLCQKILSAGAQSGKTQLMFAYVALGGSLAPMAWSEMRASRAERDAAENDPSNDGRVFVA